MNQEELFGRLMKNQISKEELERLLKGMDDESILAGYELYLKIQFENEVAEHFSKNKGGTESDEDDLIVTKQHKSIGR